jgi:phosphoribosylglycinamide formyltransferase 1
MVFEFRTAAWKQADTNLRITFYDMRIRTDFTNCRNTIVSFHPLILFTFAPMINVAIFASGEGTNAENLIQHFANHPKVKISWIVTNREEAGVVVRARKYRKGIQVISRYTLENSTEQFIEFLKTEKIDLIILAGFLLKLPEKLVEAFPMRIVNLHPALLPKFGGKGMFGINVHKAVLEAGEKESGITIHYVNEEYDKGEIVLQEKVAVEEHESPESLQEKVRSLEHRFFPLAVDLVVAKVEEKNIS